MQPPRLITGKIRLLPVVFLVGAFCAGAVLWYLLAQPRTVVTPNANEEETTTNATGAVRPIPPPPAEVADADRDGLTDEQETALGTKIDSSDSDDDGLADLAEVQAYKSNPLEPDSDGDGKRDGGEVQAGYDPNGPGVLLDVAKAIDALNTNTP